jgi:glycine cleavage system aminomethyltransferase T
VHRKFTAFVAEGQANIAPGNKISVGEKEVGEITSVAYFPDAGKNGAGKTIALGYIRREIGTPGREVILGPSNSGEAKTGDVEMSKVEASGVTAKVAAPPLANTVFAPEPALEHHQV